MKTQTAIFGGSFNPVHIGHLALANYLCEFEGIDEVWLMVTPQNPLKEQEELLEESYRLELARLATEGYGKICVSNFEFGLPRPSYTAHTLRALCESYPDRDFCLLIGADNWVVFHQWKEYEQLISGYRILVYPRRGYEVALTDLPENVKFVNTPLLEVSSTFIRQAIRLGKDIRFFLPPLVYERIKQKGYYQL